MSELSDLALDGLTPGDAVQDALLAAVKVAVRVSPSLTIYDDELVGIIGAAKRQLAVAGVAEAVLAADPLDPLVQTAITVYVKASFGMDNPEADRFMRSFDSLAAALAIAHEYQEPAVS